MHPINPAKPMNPIHQLDQLTQLTKRNQIKPFNTMKHTFSPFPFVSFLEADARAELSEITATSSPETVDRDGPIWAHLVPFGPIWAHLGSFDPIWALLAHLVPFEPFWAGPIWSPIAHLVPFGPLLPIWSQLGPFGPGTFGPILPIWSHLGQAHLVPYCPKLTQY